ncbi:MAG TPA: two-component regulator propeller domain-containing protein [Bacteroidales bacterium]|jgi:ligand-binding sensor domain-containing protein|nr:two-component regulator propeller domain-containing protein [Bacteroidales bacterium]
MKRFVVLLISILPFIPIYNADLSKIKFEYVTVDDGLSQGIVEEIFQDSRGYIWIGSHDGLNRYDGIQFTLFRRDPADPESLASNSIYSMAEDNTGKIWIGTEGLNVFDPVLNKMKRIVVNTDDPNAFQGGRVSNITIDFDSTIWIATTNGLAHYFPGKNIFRTYRNEPGNSRSLGSSSVNSTCLTHDNRLFVGPACDVIYEYDRVNDSFIEVPYKIAHYGNNNSKWIYEDFNGLIFITSEFSAVHIYNPATGETKLIDVAGGNLNMDNIRTRVLPIAPDQVWIGTDGGGINIYDPITGEIQYLIMDTRNTGSIGSNAITKIFMDRDKNIWVGHFGAGVSVWKRNKEKFESFRHNPFNTLSINREIVSAMFEDSKGRIWIGQDGGGLSIFDPAARTFEHIRRNPGMPGTLTSDVILAIHEDPSGNLLLGTYAGGMMVFDPDTRKVIKSFNATNGLASEHVWTFYKDNKNQYWLSDLRSGYSLYNPETGTFINHGTGEDPLSSCSSSVLNITKDADGKLWLGSEGGGICVIDYENQKKKGYVNDANNSNSLAGNDIKSIVFIDNYAWIATNGGGLNRLDLQTDSFKAYTMKDGLSSDALMGLLKDDQDNLWISSTKGLMKFNTKTGSVEVFDKSQGIQGNEFKYNSQLRLKDGRMMFGGVNGLTIFHPDSIKSSYITPGVVFTDFKINNESALIGAKGSPLKKHIDFTGFIKLNHKQSVFTIEFASLDYNSPVKNKYMYMLEGFDENWIETGNRRFVTYTNLDPGKYTFLLKGSNSDGVWNPTPRKLVIRVKPPWYTTKLAIALYIIAIILSIIYYIKQREKQSIQDKLILEQKIQEAQAELKSKTRKVEEHEEEIKRRNEEEKDIRFYTDGVAKMSDIIAKKRQNLEELSSAMISELVRYVGASAGGIFVVDDSDPFHTLIKASGDFCLSSDSNVNKVFEIGEGNIGACFKEKQTLTFDNLTDGYIVMRSGLGKISLHHAVYIPVIQDNMAVGVIEVASVEKLPENHIRFIEKIAESLASIITIIKANDKSNLMIEQNNAQAEELRAQEEEMRQNMEELLATQEESLRREKKLESELEIREKTILELKTQLSVLKKKHA